MTSLYICYQGINEPLSRTQVVAYLEGLALAGHTMVLLTFEAMFLAMEDREKIRAELRSLGIEWHSLPYHRSPSIPATVWDMAAGIAMGLRLIRRYQVDLIHARGHVPCVVAAALKALTQRKLLFDVRGLMAEEYADAGRWRPHGALFRATKRAERICMARADGIVALTHRAADALRQWYPDETAMKPLAVIPCCADLRGYNRPLLPPRGSGPVHMVYVGKLGGWYADAGLLDFVIAAQQVMGPVHLDVWTQSDPSALRLECDSRGIVASFGRIEPHELPGRLARADVGLSFLRRRLSAAACSPTKIGEYLAAGLAVVSTSGVGDVDALLTGEQDRTVGVLVEGSAKAEHERAATCLAQLLKNPGLADQCRSVAAAQLSLVDIGWPRYRGIYEALAS